MGRKEKGSLEVRPDCRFLMSLMVRKLTGMHHGTIRTAHTLYSGVRVFESMPGLVRKLVRTS